MSKEESDEEDYMSDAILKKGEDICPGLAPKHIAKQRQKEEKSKVLNEKSKTKSRKVLEQEKRDEGLGKSIASDNKGFSMLQKMGYTPGMVIGRTGVGRAEPVPINIKSGRGGLGREEELKRKQEEEEKWQAMMNRKRHKRNEILSADYRMKVIEKFAERQAETDLSKSQKVCEQLDREQGLSEPNEIFFWPASYLPPHKKRVLNFDANGEEIDNEEEEEETTEESVNFSSTEKLEILTGYLRMKHKYCIWCGTSFYSQDDMRRNCPGDKGKDHR